jgi:beta-galactosidase
MKRILIFLAAILFLAAKVFGTETLPLAGEWRFALDRNDVGISEKWFAQNLAEKIQLPGILQAQGFGDDIAINTPWVLTLGDAWWKIQPAELREHFSQPGHVEVPFLSQPPKHYLGAAWYQRDVTIPTNWSGKHFTLFLERVHWKSTVWLDEKEIGSDISLSTPHEFDLGNVMAGKHRLTIRVDNRTQLPVAGHLLDSHSLSDALGAAWNGIVGKIELRATPPVWIDDIEVFPNVKNKTLTVRGKIKNLSGKSGADELNFFVGYPWGNDRPLAMKKVAVSWSTNGDEFETTLDLDPTVELWDEFHTNLYALNYFLTNSDSTAANAISGHSQFFALREISTRDKDILINGRPVNLRFTHFGGDFPLTGYPAMDVASWKKIFQACKDYGFNGMRFHSWCPPEAAFAAADEMGFYLAPECALWADFGNTPTREFLEAETARILKAYGNHPSFILLSPSNEPRNYTRYLPQWAAANYVKDDRRLYAVDSGWGDPSQLTGAQYAVVARFGDNLNLRNTTGWFGGDYADALTDVHIPVLAHEVGQWCAYPDFDVMKKFTGYLQPGNYDIFKFIAEQNGILDEDKNFAFASGKFQLACYKEEIEANLRTPGLAGFELLDLHDYLGQGTALIGVLDAFWESKGYASADEFKKFCAPIVPLAWLKKRVFTTDEKLDADIGLAQFGSAPLTNTFVTWEILNDQGNLVGICPSSFARDIPVGFKGKELNFGLTLSNLPAPASYKLVAKVGDIKNDWNFWLYPAHVEDSKAADVFITHNWNEAETNLVAGKKVLFLPTAADLDSSKCPPMKNVPVFWNIQMTVRPPQNRSPRFDAFLGLLCDTKSPGLAEFPTDVNCDWQWTPLINNVRAINLTGTPKELRPMVWAIDDWNRNWKLGVIFECNVGAGKLLVSAIDLEKESADAELKQLRRSLLDYMGSEKFNPAATLTTEQANALWSHEKSDGDEPKRVFDPDLNDGTIPQPKKQP